MTPHLCSTAVSRRRIAAVTLMILIAAGAIKPSAWGAEVAEQAHSLRAVPADAAFYSASLRLKEQLDIFLASNAYARLMEIPVIQWAKTQATVQWQQSPQETVAKVREYVQSPPGQAALAMLKEMFSEEMFLYAGGDVAESLKLLMELNGIRRTARLEALARGDEPEQVMTERVLEVLSDHADQFKVPSLVFGWRIHDATRAGRLLNEVHSVIRDLLDDQRPELAAHLQRDQIAGHEFLTLRLDGSMIPWDQLRDQADEIDPEQFEKWRQLFSNKTVAVALGVTDEYVLLSIGDSTDHLETIGQGPSLAGQPAIARLNKHADQRVVSIAYVSEALARSLTSPEQTIDDLAGAAEEILQAAEIAEEQRMQLVEDIRGLGGDLKKYLPEPGDLALINFLTNRGYEGFQYQSGSRPMVDSSKPLTLLNQTGGNPMLLFATRSKESPEDYELTVSWLKRVAGHVEQIVESKADAEDWAKYQQYRDQGIELLKRLDRANREHLIPALADGQGALVMDVAAESTRWFAKMPASPKPLPMLELSFVSGVSNAEQLRQGVAEYLDVARDTIALLREINPDEMPDFQLPQPERRELAEGGTLYVYPLPDEWGFDSQLAVNAGLTDSVGVISVYPVTTERLLRATPLDIDTSLDLTRPAAAVVHFQFGKLIDAVQPWIDYGFDVAMGKLQVEEEGEEDAETDDEDHAQQAAVVMQMGFILPQVHQFLDVAKALRSASSVTYQEDGLWVTHSETHIQDVK